MTKKLEIEQTEIESPYELPEGWKWESLEKLCSIPITDGTHQTPTYSDSESGISFISSKDVTKEFIDWSNIKYITKELHSELYKRVAPQIDDILLAKNGTTGVAAIVDTDKIFDIYVTLALVRPNKEKVLPRYLLQVINSPVCKNQFDEHLTGIGVPNLHLRDIKITKIPLPPTLAEQKRIVSRIETLFAKLDEAEEKARTVLDSFETRKAAILHKAFTGELTANWRKENGISDDSWEEKTIGELYAINPKTKADDDIAASFIPMEKIEANAVNRFSFEVKAWGSIKKNHTQFQDGDVCFAKISPCFENGKAFIAEGLENGIGAGTTELIILRNADVDTHFTFYLVTDLSFVRGGCATYSGTVGQQRINMDYVRNYKVLLPSLPEQQEIVRILDNVLEKESRAKEAAQTVLDQITLLKKSILARAFRGEL